MNELILQKTSMEPRELIIALLLAGLSCGAGAATQEDEFRSPPHPARPWVHWINMDWRKV